MTPLDPLESAEGLGDKNSSWGRSAFNYGLEHKLEPEAWFTLPNGFINPRLILSRSSGGAPAPTANSLTKVATVATAASANCYAALSTKRRIRYIMALGGRAIFAAAWDVGVVGNTRLAGVGDAAEGYFFGYDGTSFGILHRYGGLHEIRKFTVTNAAGGAENVVMTVDGTAVPVVLAAGSIEATAWQLAQADYGGIGRGWDAYQLDDTVVLIARDARAASGAFTFTPDAGGTAAAAPSLVHAGQAPTGEDWTPQTSWSEDACPWLTKTNGNIYAISYQWRGEIRFFVENPERGYPTLVHLIPWTNSASSYNASGAQHALYVSSENTTNDTAVAVYCGSAVGYSEASTQNTQSLDWAVDVDASGITTERSVLALRCCPAANGVTNNSRVRLLELSAYGDAASTKAVVVRIYRDVVFTTPQDYAMVSPNSYTSYSAVVSAVTLTNAIEVWSGCFGCQSSVPPMDLSKLEAVLSPGESIAVTVECSVAVAVNIGLRFREEF